MKLYVGNLPWKIGNAELKDLFESYGDIEDAVVITDKFTRRSKGFGFVTFTSEEDGKKAMSEMHEKDIEGRALTVNEAQPMKREFSDREERPSSSRDAPSADPSEINNHVEDSMNDSAPAPEVVDNNSDAEDKEEDIETAEEAKEDAEDDKSAAETAPKAEETTEEAEDEALIEAKSELAEAEKELEDIEEEEPLEPETEEPEEPEAPTPEAKEPETEAEKLVEESAPEEPKPEAEEPKAEEHSEEEAPKPAAPVEGV